MSNSGNRTKREKHENKFEEKEIQNSKVLLVRYSTSTIFNGVLFYDTYVVYVPQNNLHDTNSMTKIRSNTPISPSVNYEFINK